MPDVDTSRIPASPDKTLDMAQAFARKGTTYIGNTGFGYGDSEAVAYSEQLFGCHAEELAKARNRQGTVGQAFIQAKQRYLFTMGAAGFGVFDEKALVGNTLFGIPNYRLGPEPAQTATATANISSPLIAPQPVGAGDLAVQELTVAPTLRLVTNGPSEGTTSFYAADGFIVQTGAGQSYSTSTSPEKQVGLARPTSPKVDVDVAAAGTKAHGSLLLSASYSVTTGFRPHVGNPVYAGNPDATDVAGRIGWTRQYTSPTWWPAKQGTINSLGRAAGEPEQLVALPAQFRSPDGSGVGTERVFKDLTFAVYYSNSGQRLAPWIRSVQASYDVNALRARFSVEGVGRTIDGQTAPLRRVLLTWTDKTNLSGRWQSLDLQQVDATRGLWEGYLPAVPGGIEYFVQVVDAYGNVTQADNKGLYYAIDTPMSPTPAFTFAPAIADEGAPVQFTDKSKAAGAVGAITAWAWSFGDGSASAVQNPAHAFPDNGVYSVTLRVTDTSNLSASTVQTVTVLNRAPVVVGPIATRPIPVQVRQPVEATAPFTDAGTLDTHIATWGWGDGTSSNGAVTETRGSGTAAGSHAYAAAGFYTVTLTVADKDGGSAQKSYKNVVVYDPDAGFASGGGWVELAAGSYQANPSLAGRLSFGLTARYLKDATVPTGQTEVQFQAGNLNFHTTSYEWLVVVGQRAYLQGAGTISNAGSYGFLLAVADEQTTGNTGTDKVRIRIWDKASGATVYDSQKEGDIPAYPSLALAGGSVQIQK